MRIILLFTAFLMLFAGCSKKEEPKLSDQWAVGTWKLTSLSRYSSIYTGSSIPNETLLLSSDHFFSRTCSNGTNFSCTSIYSTAGTMSGTWSLNEEQTQLEVNIPSGSSYAGTFVIYIRKISDSKITSTDGTGTVTYDKQ
ncbi:MAG TPA: hypothetical protein DHW82_07335 [Spirochaetia bacterium]|nr:MAG: hypothetical protein A2Y41_11775 [Spirochaetes bacterium GWB1_36_13]HCL56805.1 hypothetical protein [Spirochaetia bacterium]